MTPKEKARESIDGMLAAAGWVIQTRTDANIDAGRGVAMREFALGRGFGEADYLLFVDGQAAGVVSGSDADLPVLNRSVVTIRLKLYPWRPFVQAEILLSPRSAD